MRGVDLANFLATQLFVIFYECLNSSQIFVSAHNIAQFATTLMVNIYFFIIFLRVLTMHISVCNRMH